MKKFWEIMSDDYREENFTLKEKLLYGLAVPAGMIAIIGIAGWLETLV